eukprot:1155161-Pelagomonas_calceolata.AAC.2
MASSGSCLPASLTSSDCWALNQEQILGGPVAGVYKLLPGPLIGRLENRYMQPLFFVELPLTRLPGTQQAPPGEQAPAVGLQSGALCQDPWYKLLPALTRPQERAQSCLGP